ncbi:MAG: pyridoxal-phosphate dependent enzyme [Sphaerochaetaceae bacterium]|nr:pyridoxal-phosphate dependent enzyme [Sphaerochaetaceae bacterium]
MKEVTIASVFEASRRIYPTVRHTPLLDSEYFTSLLYAERIAFKAEMFQETGSFKERGAANRILSLSDEQKERGVITFSTGNHGRAVASVASRNNIKAVVCVSKRVPSYRVEAMKALGAEVVQDGDSQDEAELIYERLKKERNLIPVVPFDDPYVVSGQGTISLELYQQLEGLDTLIVPLSGGGLLAGTAFTIKQLKPSVQVIGVSIECSPVMLRSVEEGKPVQIAESDTLADSLLGGIGMENHYTLDLVSRFVDTHVVVNEEETATAMRALYQNMGLVVEGAGSVPLAAALSGKLDLKGKHAALVCTGRNVDFNQYRRVIEE